MESQKRKIRARKPFKANHSREAIEKYRTRKRKPREKSPQFPLFKPVDTVPLHGWRWLKDEPKCQICLVECIEQEWDQREEAEACSQIVVREGEVKFICYLHLRGTDKTVYSKVNFREWGENQCFNY